MSIIMNDDIILQSPKFEISPDKNFRSYTLDNIVAKQYYNMRKNQTWDYARHIKETNLLRLDKANLENDFKDVLWCIERLDDFVDKSDPDISLSNIHHLYQTAERIKKDGLPDWMQLIGFIHDLGKMYYLWGNQSDGTTIDTQWGLVGDTYILGCRLRNDHVYPEFDKLCPDMNDDLKNTDIGVYYKGCGLSKCVYTWGHDEYLFDVLQHNRKNGNISSEFPVIADYIIRYHSLYPWHSYGHYIDFEEESDSEIKKYVQLFNKYDLYTKENNPIKIDDVLKDYYQKLILKYFPSGKLIF